MVWLLAVWFPCVWAASISRVSPVTLNPLCSVGGTRDCGNSTIAPLESLTLSSSCNGDGCQVLGYLNKGRARPLDSAQAWDTSNSDVVISMTWNTDYLCPEGYFLMSFRTTLNPNNLSDITELHCNRPTNLLTSYTSIVKNTSNPWVPGSGAGQEFSCPTLSYLIGFGVRGSGLDAGGSKMDVSDLILICAYPLDSLCSTNSLVSTNTTVNAPCDYQYCVANISCLSGFQAIPGSGSQFVECTTSGWNSSAVRCVAADVCVNSSSVCPANSACTNLLGDYRCDCNPGFVSNASRCDNVNECLSPCLIGEIDPVAAQCNNCSGFNLACQDLPGSFQCVNLTVNECLIACNATVTTNCHNCTLPSNCTDLPTGFACTCPSGYSSSDSGATCTDINECNTNPCDSTSTCINTNGSYYCSCNPGFNQTGGVCVDINECMSSPCLGANTCVNTPGSYFCLPVILALQFGVPAPFTLTSTTQTSSDNVMVTIQNERLCSREPTLFYGSKLVPQDFRANCVNVTWNSSITIMNCYMAPGAGVNLTGSFRCCASGVCGYSPSSSLMFSYPRPTLQSSTLTFSGSLDPLGQPRINANQTSAILTMSGTNFFPSETAVTFGSNFTCTPLIVTYTQITCVPSINAVGVNLSFTAIVGTGGSEQSSAVGADLVSFTGDPPVITSIIGCTQRSVGVGITDCPTSGSVSLVVSGRTTKFNNLTNPKLMIDGYLCAPIGNPGPSSFNCTLPPGTGIDVTVEIRDVSGSSFMNIISYSRPQITSIMSSVCTSITNLTMINCSQSSFTISILGNNFGESGALVQINNNVFQANHVDSFSGEASSGPNGKHRHLTVDVPSSITVANNVLYVLQYNGVQSNESATFGLVPCAVGSGRDSTGSCVACDVGRMASVPELCVDCPAGSSQAQPGQTSCSRCAAGQAQNASGQSFCTNCGVGLYSFGTGNTVCASCVAGRYSPNTANTGCTSCPAGTVSGPKAAICSDCVPGYFSLGNAVICQACPPGRVSQTNRSSTCNPCQFGTFKAIEGSSICADCPLGSYSEAQGSSFCVECQAGTAQLLALQACSSCPSGSFQSQTGASNCSQCAAGFYSDVAGSTACQACDAGRYSGQGFSTCMNCEVGYEQPLSGSSNCTMCNPGYYSSSIASRTCDACAAGYFQGSIGTSSCNYCVPGGYAPAQGSTACLQCSPGYFQPAVGQQRCIPCPAGTASGVFGSSQCVDCQPGSAASQSASISCDLCLPGQYNDQANAVICLSCPPGHIASRGGSVSCPKCPATATPNDLATGCLCGLGQYTQNYNGTLECLQCPRGSFCGILGLTSDDLVSLAGWWRTDNTSLQFYRCKNPHFCLAQDQCAMYREGPMCALCIDGYRSGGPTKDCAACPAKDAAWGLAILIILLLLAALCIMYYIVIRLSNIQQGRLLRLVDTSNKIALTNLNNKLAVDDNHFEAMRREQRLQGGEPDFVDDEDDQETEVQEIKLKLTAADTSRRAPNFMYKVKILLGFFQIASFLPAQGDVSWPTAFADFIEAFAIFNFDFIPWQTLGCATTFSYFTKALIVGLIPLIVVAVLVIYFSINVFISDRASLQDQMLKQQRRLAIWRQFVRLVLFTVFLLYPFVSKITLGVYNCVTIEDHSYLVADFTLACYDDLWQSYAIGIGFFVALYPIGIPLAYFLILRNMRAEMGEPGTIVMLGFLYEAYVTEAWYWELVDLLHKLILTSVVVFVSSQARMACNMAIIVVYLMGLLLVSPYVRKGDDRFHQLVQVNLYCLALCGHILNSTDDPYSTTFASPDTLNSLLSALLICITIGLMIGFLIIAGRNVKKIVVARRLAMKKAAAAAQQTGQDTSKIVSTNQSSNTVMLEPASAQISSLSPAF